VAEEHRSSIYADAPNGLAGNVNRASEGGSVFSRLIANLGLAYFQKGWERMGIDFGELSRTCTKDGPGAPRRTSLYL